MATSPDPAPVARFRVAYAYSKSTADARALEFTIQDVEANGRIGAVRAWAKNAVARGRYRPACYSDDTRQQELFHLKHRGIGAWDILDEAGSRIAETRIRGPVLRVALPLRLRSGGVEYVGRDRERKDALVRPLKMGFGNREWHLDFRAGDGAPAFSFDKLRTVADAFTVSQYDLRVDTRALFATAIAVELFGTGRANAVGP